MPFRPRANHLWRLRSRSIELGVRTLVMGILNVTPDSFSDGGMFVETSAAVQRGLAMLDEGAHLLDLGGESTRPGAKITESGEEQERVLPVLEGIRRAKPDAIVSIDTYHAATARAAVEAGAEIVNDVSGGLWDKEMPGVCAELGCGVVLMHTRGRPWEWTGLSPLNWVASVVKEELAGRVADARLAEVSRERIAIDPGFGFGKMGVDNFALLAGLDGLRDLSYPVVTGVSRKGFLGQVMAPLYGGEVPAAGRRIHGTVAANVAAILNGAHVLRVHDVLPGLEAAVVADAVLAGCEASN